MVVIADDFCNFRFEEFDVAEETILIIVVPTAHVFIIHNFFV